MFTLVSDNVVGFYSLYIFFFWFLVRLIAIIYLSSASGAETGLPESRRESAGRERKQTAASPKWKTGRSDFTPTKTGM